jgi:hypothetical protein
VFILKELEVKEAPTARGILYDYQKKGDAGGVVWTIIKTKGIEEGRSFAGCSFVKERGPSEMLLGENPSRTIRGNPSKNLRGKRDG